MLNICSSVQDHNQSTIHRDSDWTSHRAKEIYLKLKASGRMRLKNCVWRKHLKNASEELRLKKASEELRLKKRVWRRAPEDTSSEARPSEAYLIRSKAIRSYDHQKHISSEARSSEAMTIRSISHQKLPSSELTKDNVRSVRPLTLHLSLQPPSL